MYDEVQCVELVLSERSVLDRLSHVASKNVASQILDDLSHQLPNAVECQNVVSYLNDEDLKWFMQVTCFSLGLSFATDYGTIRNAVRLYCDWITCAMEKPNSNLPQPLIEQPLFYASKIVNHLHQLFVPRPDSSQPDVILRQTKECHNVLRCVQQMMNNLKPSLKDVFWPTVLQFLLSISDLLLSPPAEVDDVSDHLCDRIFDVLYELWLMACAGGNFPSPSFWKTFKCLFAKWRHRVQTIDHWVRICLVLTDRQLKISYADSYSKIVIGEEDRKFVPNFMPPAIVAQTWFRVLHLNEEPLKMACGYTTCCFGSRSARNIRTTSSVEDGAAYSILSQLSSQNGYQFSPYAARWQYAFFRMLKGVHCLISGLLGEEVDCSFKEPDHVTKDLNSLFSQYMASAQFSTTASANSGSSGTTSQSAFLIKAAMSLGSSSKSSKNVKQAVPSRVNLSFGQIPDSVVIYALLRLMPVNVPNIIVHPVERPTVQSLCNFFGEWLFSVSSAALDLNAKRSSSVELLAETVSQKSGGSQHSSGADNSTAKVAPTSLEAKNFLENLPSVSGFQAGKAEALAALCKMFSSNSYKEIISDKLLSRFYSVLLMALLEADTIITSYIVVHCINLFRVELKGVEMLMPYFLDTIDSLCIEPDKTKIHPSVSDVLLRSACMQLLSSLIALPTFYGKKQFSDVSDSNSDQIAFISMRSRILRILIHEMKIELDSHNLQTCICLVSLLCHASWLWEKRNESLIASKSPGESAFYFTEILRTVLPILYDLLCNKWNCDYGICLAIIDCFCFLIGFLAPVPKSYTLNMQDIVLHLCRFIESQLSKPPPAHSRDMHSTVVAAYYGLETILIHAPNILMSGSCLQNITGVIQLGLTGVKAAESPSSDEADSVKLNKKSASQRVHDAAEQLLHTLFNRVGLPFIMCSAPEDEKFASDKLRKEQGEADLKFHYYLVENTRIFGLSNVTGDNTLPRSILIVRSPYISASAWMLTFRNADIGQPIIPPMAKRPEGVEKPKLVYPPSRYFPVDMDKIDQCAIDAVIPTNVEMTSSMEKLKQLLEERDKSRPVGSPEKLGDFKKLDIKPSGFKDSVNASKLFLNAFGYLDFNDGNLKCQLLNSEDPNFSHDLANLVDNCPTRFVHTIHAFYVSDKGSSAISILQNGSQLDQTPDDFRGLLSNFGSGIDVNRSCVWSGHLSRSYYNSHEEKSEDESTDTEDFVLDGQDHALYWATALVELAVLVPTIRSFRWSDKNRTRQDLSNSGNQTAAVMPPLIHSVAPPRSKSLSHDVFENFQPPTDALKANPHGLATNRYPLTVVGGAAVSKKRHMIHQDHRTLLVWLEEYDDYRNFPLDELLPTTDIGEDGSSLKSEAVYVIYVWPMKTGLYRIKISSSFGRLGIPHPLIDNAVISFDLLANAIRQTILSIALRRRLENETFMPPFVRRRQKIQDFGAKYAENLSYPDFICKLLSK